MGESSSSLSNELDEIKIMMIINNYSNDLLILFFCVSVSIMMIYIFEKYIYIKCAKNNYLPFFHSFIFLYHSTKKSSIRDFVLILFFTF